MPYDGADRMNANRQITSTLETRNAFHGRKANGIIYRSQMAHLGSAGAVVALHNCQGGVGLHRTPLFVPTKETPSRFRVPWHVGNYSSQRMVQVPVLPRNKLQQLQNYVVSDTYLPATAERFQKFTVYWLY